MAVGQEAHLDGNVEEVVQLDRGGHRDLLGSILGVDVDVDQELHASTLIDLATVGEEGSRNLVDVGLEDVEGVTLDQLGLLGLFDAMQLLQWIETLPHIIQRDILYDLVVGDFVS